MMMPDNTLTEIKAMSFETAFTALQENVAQLESEDLPLEKALALFERGQVLARHCAALLEEAELKVRTLMTETSDSLGMES
jgi:exodeoxyribonuclease VII small subunit